jgi:L-threonylcarbamoyladenylate synthase
VTGADSTGADSIGADLTLTPDDARRFEECVAGGGVAVFPADTVYGIGCNPETHTAVERLYELKGRPATQPAAVMFFSLEAAYGELAELGERERAALEALLPGPVTLLLPNRERRFPLACGPQPDTLGLRVPLLTGTLAALGAVTVPVLQSSANISGEPAVRRLAEVPPALRDGADLVLDGGELPGTASTVVDLRGYEERGEWCVVRAGPVEESRLERLLASPA